MKQADLAFVIGAWIFGAIAFAFVRLFAGEKIIAARQGESPNVQAFLNTGPRGPGIPTRRILPDGTVEDVPAGTPLIPGQCTILTLPDIFGGTREQRVCYNPETGR